MAVPGFESPGLFLPAGAYAGPLPGGGDVDIHAGWPTDEHELHARFVGMYQESNTRAALWQELLNLKAQVSKELPCALYFVSGGFVMDVDNALDIHLVLVVPAHHLANLGQSDLYRVTAFFDDREHEFAGDLKSTTQFVKVYPTHHQRFDETLVGLGMARYACDRPAQDERIGGYVQFQDCEGGDDDDQILGLLADATAPADAA